MLSENKRRELHFRLDRLPGISVIGSDNDPLCVVFTVQSYHCLKDLIQIVNSEQFAFEWHIAVEWDDGLKFVLLGEERSIGELCDALKALDVLAA